MLDGPVAVEMLGEAPGRVRVLSARTMRWLLPWEGF